MMCIIKSCGGSHAFSSAHRAVSAGRRAAGDGPMRISATFIMSSSVAVCIVLDLGKMTERSISICGCAPGRLSPRTHRFSIVPSPQMTTTTPTPTMENRVRMLEAQQLQLLESVTVLQREVRRLDDTDNAPHPKRARTEPNPLQELAEQLDQPPHGTRGAARPVDPASSRPATQERQRDDHAAHHQGAHPRTHRVDE